MSHSVKRHPFHLVDPSPWPLLASFSALTLTFGAVLYFHGYNDGEQVLISGFITLVLIAILWWRDVIREATFLGNHTLKVQYGLRFGMLLFIISEVMFFAGFFWGFFWLGFAPSIELNLTWPPNDLQNLIFSPFEIPLLNTIILLTSGTTITISHFFIKLGDFEFAKKFLITTLVLAFLFLVIQLFEYFTAPFDISDGAYSSIFYICTGFHGFHVIVGAIFISVMLKRLFFYSFSRMHHFGFEAAAWYWHFVDVVWLFLYVLIYYWGSDLTHLDYDNIFFPINEVLDNMKKDGISLSFELKKLDLDVFSSINFEDDFVELVKND